MEKTVCKAGCLAWIDTTFCGLLKVKVLEIHNNGSITFKITSKKNRYYKAGEVLNFSKALLFPRQSIRRRKFGSHYFIGGFSWE